MASNVEKLPEKKNKLTALSTASNNPIVNAMTTVRESGVDADSLRNPWNTDDIYIKGGDYSIYEDMLKDDQVNIALAIKKDLIVGSGYQFICEDEDSQEIREDLEIAFKEDFEGSFEDSLLEILTAYEFGFSITEKQFTLREDNSLTLKCLKTRHPVSWLFHQDEFGKVIRYEQQGTSPKFEDVNPDSIIHFINNPRFDNPYGTSDLRAAYAAYFIKQQIIRYYAIFMEKAASPIPIAKYDKNIAEDADIQKIHDTIKRFQASTAMTIPKEFEVDFVEAKGNGEVYINGINIFNMFIGRSLFVPDLLGFQGKETTGGSQALGQEQMQVFFKHIMRRRRTIEKMVNKHLVEPIVKWNHGDVEKYPKFKFMPIEERQAEMNAKLWLEAIRSPSYKVTNEDINHFKKIIDFPETEFDEMEEDPIEDIAANEPDPNKVDVEKEDKDMFAQSERSRKIDFKSLGSILDSSLDLFVANSKPIINEIYESLYSSLRDPANKNIEKIKVSQPKMRKLKKLLDKSFSEVWEKSTDIARAEVEKSDFAIQPAKEFIETLDAENFGAIGDWEYEIMKGARVEMVSAIKDGKPLSSVIDVLDETGKKALQVSTERYARTKFTEVMNKARINYFNETGIVAGYEYSAILDGRTSEICQGLHGKKFKAGTEPVPPLHFNCRSLLIPITKFEEFKPDKNMDGFIEKNIGKGFAKQ